MRLDQNYSDRRVGSQSKNQMMEKYDKFIQQEIEKRPNGMPRTEKRIISSQGRYEYGNLSSHIPESVGSDKKDIEEWKRKLVKKSRVLSNNILGSRKN